ncbi:MAG TPA: alkaline phosphatase family protein [Acidimicrobiales bacterium]|nr:alkaline phosphatase family protein [Acidimicrobiales bacterium]
MVALGATALVASACGAAGKAPSHGAGTRGAGTHGAGTPGSTSTPAAPGREGIPAFRHLFVVVMENLSAANALAVPSIAALAHQYASASSWYAASHPSLPNYLALVAGSTFGVGSDCTDCYQPPPSLADQLEQAGVPWGAYFEGMPGPCYLGPQSPDGSYAAKHDPFRYFTDVRASPTLCAHLQPLGALTDALGAGDSAVPRFVWVTPSMCHSGHDCAPAVAGAWLSGFVQSVVSRPWWGPGCALVVTWDESEGDNAGVVGGLVTSGGGGGRVLTLVVSPGIAGGEVVATTYDHYSLLRTVEDAFGLPLLGQAAAAGTAPMTAFWAGG